MLEKILVPLDGSALAEAILPQVERILHCKDAQVMLLRVVPEPLVGEKTASGEDMTALARRELEVRLELLRMQGAQVDCRVLAGDPADAILRFAGEYKPSLIALSTHGRTGLARWIRGSVAERVLRGSPFPVLLLNPHAIEAGAKPGAHRFRKIIVPLTFSEESEKVLPLVAGLASLHESEVILFHAVETLVGDFPVGTVVLGSWKEAEALLEAARGKLAGIRTRTKVVTGLPPAAAILDAAEEEKADLVALTTHARSDTSRWLYGSVAEQVLRHCRTPLLVARTGGFDAERAAAAADEAWRKK